MANDITIADSVWEKIAEGITTVRNASSSFNKDMSITLQKLETLNKTKAVLRVEANQAKHELEEAEKQFQNTGKAADKMALQTASLRFDDLKNNLGFLTDNIKNTEKSMNDLVGTASKADNRVGGLNLGGVLKGLAGSELVQMAINTGLNVAATGISSALGSNAGNIFNSTVNDAITGAVAGFAVAGPAGAAVGGLAGGTLGFVNGKVDEYKEKDDVYKAKVKSEADGILQGQNDESTKSQLLSMQKEDDKFEIKNMVGGNDRVTQSIMSDVTNLSSDIPLEYNQLMAVTKTLLHYNKPENVKSMLKTLSDAGAGLNMDGDGINQIASDLGILGKKSKITESDLSALESGNIDIGKYIGSSEIANGLNGQEAVSKILEGLNKEFNGKTAEKAETTSGKKILLENLLDTNLVAEGDSFNAKERESLDNQIKFQRDHGMELYFMRSKIGESNGDLQLTSDNNYINEMSKMLTGQTILKNGIDINKASSIKGDRSGWWLNELLGVAKVKADDATETSLINQNKEASNLDLYANIQIEVNQDEKNYSYDWNLAQASSKGRAEANKNFKGPGVNVFATSVFGLGGLPINLSPAEGKGEATGIFRVPYNNFPALLHEGETVSTAVEARSAKYGSSVTITGNSFVVREEADIDKIARAFVEKLAKISAVAMVS